MSIDVNWNAERTADFPRKAWQNYASAWQCSATCCFGGQNRLYLERQNWEVLIHPPYSPDIAAADYHCFERWRLACIHFSWRMQKMGEFLDRLKRPRVYRTWNPYVVRKMGKGCSKRRPILPIKYILPIFYNKTSNFKKSHELIHIFYFDICIYSYSYITKTFFDMLSYCIYWHILLLVII